MHRNILLLLLLVTLAFSSLALGDLIEVVIADGMTLVLDTEETLRVASSSSRVPAIKLRVGDIILHDDGTSSEIIEVNRLEPHVRDFGNEAPVDFANVGAHDNNGVDLHLPSSRLLMFSDTSTMMTPVAPLFSQEEEARIARNSLISIAIGGLLFYFHPDILEQPRNKGSRLHDAVEAHRHHGRPVEFQGVASVFEQYLEPYIRYDIKPNMDEVRRNGHEGALNQLIRNLRLLSDRAPVLGALPIFHSESMSRVKQFVSVERIRIFVTPRSDVRQWVEVEADLDSTVARLRQNPAVVALMQAFTYTPDKENTLSGCGFPIADGLQILDETMSLRSARIQDGYALNLYAEPALALQPARLHFILPNKQAFWMRIRLDESEIGAKFLVQRYPGLPVNKSFYLIFRGRWLQRGWPLRSYGVVDGSEIYVCASPHSCGGDRK